jgi:hypothetical protein
MFCHYLSIQNDWEIIMVENLSAKRKTLDRRVVILSWMVGFLVLVGLIVAGYGLIIYQPLIRGQNDVSNLTNLGTFFQGAVASIWALAGVILIYVAFLGQKQQLINQQEELKQNREELEATRKEMQEQKIQMQRQNETMMLQRFESGFFELLRFHSGLIDTLKHNFSTVIYHGRDCFKLPLSTIYAIYSKNNTSEPKPELEEICEKIFDQHQEMMGHYLLNLLSIFQFIEDSDLHDLKKRRYAKIVRSQLSLIEKKILFYYGITKKGKEYWSIIIKYNLINDIPQGSLPDPHHINYYPYDVFDRPEQPSIPLADVLEGKI